MRLIGIHGKARSGKDELCRILCDTYGFKRIAFADAIRDLAVKYFETPREETLDKKTKESRRILQGIGVSIRNYLTKTNDLLNSPIESTIIETGVSGFPRWVEIMATTEFGIEVVDLKRKLKYNRIVMNGLVEMWNVELSNFVKVANGIDKDIWINTLLNACINKNVVYIIPDVRFENEYTMFQSLQYRSDTPSYGKVVR
jgi:hypothetical protein